MKENPIVSSISFKDFCKSLKSMTYFSWINKETGEPFFTLEGVKADNSSYKVYSSKKAGLLSKPAFMEEAAKGTFMLYTLQDNTLKVGYPLVEGEDVDLSAIIG